MRDKKPIDYVDLGKCEQCGVWEKPDYYEVQRKAYYYCLLNGNKVQADESCSLVDRATCPIHKHSVGRK